MKNLIIALFLISAPAFALKSRQVTFSAANPLPINYSTGGQSRIISELGTSNKNDGWTSIEPDTTSHDAPTSKENETPQDSLAVGKMLK